MEEWRLKCLKARQNWKRTSHCREGLGRMWWCRNVTSDTTLSLQETYLLRLWPRSALVWPRALQHASLPQYWIGRAFPFSVWSLKAEALTDPGSVLSDSGLEHDLALSVKVEGARPQGVWDDRTDHIGRGSSPAKEGMVLSVWHEIRATDMGSQSHKQSPSHCPPPTLKNNNNVPGWQMGRKTRPESAGTLCACSETRAKQLWLCLRISRPARSVLARKVHCQRPPGLGRSLKGWCEC